MRLAELVKNVSIYRLFFFFAFIYSSLKTISEEAFFRLQTSSIAISNKSLKYVRSRVSIYFGLLSADNGV